MIPTLQTERLTLRPYMRSDFEPYAALMAGARGRWLGGPHDAEKAWTFFTNDAAAGHIDDWGCFTLEQDGAPIGFAGVIHSPDFPEPELGWGLYDGFEGKGLATEAARSILLHFFSKTSRESLVSYIHPKNERSIAVATRLGAAHDTTSEGPAGWGCRVYRHIKGATQ